MSLRQAKDLMDRSYAEPLDLDAVAAAAGYSRFHFVRSFREAYGRTPRRYLSDRRIERACDLLRSANLAVTEICALVGFASLGTFSARFKRKTGLSPSAYREREVARGGPPPVPGCYVLMWGHPAERQAPRERLPSAPSEDPQSRRSAPRRPLVSSRRTVMTGGS